MGKPVRSYVKIDLTLLWKEYPLVGVASAHATDEPQNAMESYHLVAGGPRIGRA